MSSAGSRTPSLTRKLVITATLALLALAYTPAARPTEQAVEAAQVCAARQSVGSPAGNRHLKPERPSP